MTPANIAQATAADGRRQNSLLGRRMRIMGERGNVIIIILVAFIVLAILPVIVTSLFWPAKILMQIIMIFVLYTTVRGFLGSGTITLVVSAILIYFMAFKYFEIFLSLYILQLLLGLQFLSVVIWGLGTTARRG